MTTTPVTLLSKRSGNASDRPVVTTVQNGELAINFASTIQAENSRGFSEVGEDKQLLIAIVTRFFYFFRPSIML